MRRIKNKWDDLAINRKIFVITTSLSLGLVITMYLILYFLLPAFYTSHKIKSLEENLSYLSKRAERSDLSGVINDLYDFSERTNTGIILRDMSGKIKYTNKELSFLTYTTNKQNDLSNKYYGRRDSIRNYKQSMILNLKNSETPYFLDVSMPLQPIDEAAKVILALMPITLSVAMILSIICAYVFSERITKPLIDIIESERMQEAKRKEFIATISHELKTPITIISGQLEGMIYNIGKYKDRDTYLKKSYESTQELKTLVEEMIQVSKYEILERPSQTKEIDLLELINRLLKRQTYLIEEKEITVNVYGEENFTIEVDEERITKAISNIINNGIKYSPNNSELNIRLLNKDKKILEIQNTGTTIDEKLKDKIFKPFFRVEKSRNRKTGGSGLGLYIVSQVLKEYNFKYNIKNRKDSVVFTIEFSDK
ncbi:MAG: HAMP domain-containing histidine kinase [Peptostreptococcaceae bacterium]|nr:HAMP domain-containing histidine kinase [Peptostreptococcaceae bacterium]